MLTKSWFSTLLFITILSCNDDLSYPPVTQGKQTISYNIEGTYNIPLDNETSGLMSYMIAAERNGKETISFLNDNNNLIYSYQEGTLIDKIDVKEYGIKRKIQGFYFDCDTLYVYTYGTEILYKLDLVSKKCLADWSFSVDTTDNVIVPSPYLSSATPIVKYNNEIICSGFKSGESSHMRIMSVPTLSRLNTTTGKVDLMLEYPEIYKKYSWTGELVYRLPYLAKGNHAEIIISFAAYPFLYCIDLDSNTISSHYAGYSKMKGPYPFKKRQGKITLASSEKVWNWYMTNGSYENILYDKYRNIYYRIARMPVNGEIQHHGNNKPTVVLVLDNKFEKIGEIELPESMSINPYHSIVLKEGLAIQKRDDNEDVLSFYIISVH